MFLHVRKRPLDFYKYKAIRKIENVLNWQPSSLREWFVYDKLSIHFGKINLNQFSCQTFRVWKSLI